MEPDRALPGTFVRFLDRRMVRTQLGLHHNVGAVTQATATELIVATEGPQAVRCLRSDVAIKRLRVGRNRELRGELTTAQLASKRGIHQTMVGEWKRQAVEGLAAVFSDRSAAQAFGR